MTMRLFFTSLALGALLGSTTPAIAGSYVFDVDYFGNDVATLAAGSDDPTATTLFAGDDFDWTITAEDGWNWSVEAGGSFFPLMAFATLESGIREGDFTLALLLDDSVVFTLTEANSSQELVHIGTNEVVLATGLRFDQMHLSYSLLDAHEELDPTAPIGSTPASYLPIFGAPEMNRFYPGIIYTTAVPEPGSLALVALGLSGAGIFLKRGRRV